MTTYLQSTVQYLPKLRITGLGLFLVLATLVELLYLCCSYWLVILKMYPV